MRLRGARTNHPTENLTPSRGMGTPRPISAIPAYRHVVVRGGRAADLSSVVTRFERASGIQSQWPRRVGSSWCPDADSLLACYCNPCRRRRALLDVRVRKAWAHALKKQPVDDGRFQGLAVRADALVSPTAYYLPTADQAIMNYPYDPRQNEPHGGQLARCGLRPACDVYVNCAIAAGRGPRIVHGALIDQQGRWRGAAGGSYDSWHPEGGKSLDQEQPRCLVQCRARLPFQRIRYDAGPRGAHPPD